MVEVIIPPTIGAATGLITSEPIPPSQSIGTRLASTEKNVSSFGRSLGTAPSTAASSISLFVSPLFVIRWPQARAMIKASGRQVPDHDDARLNCDSEQRNVPDPNGRAEVVAEEPLQNESADHGVKGSRNEHESFADIFFFPSTDGAMMGYFDLDQIRLS